MPTQLLAIRQFRATLRLRTGMLIGAGDTEMHIGGADKTVQRHPHTNHPYIPGSSQKGKIRSLLEWRAGVIGVTEGDPVKLEHLRELQGDKHANAEAILRLFGFPPPGSADERELARLGPTRLAFSDASLTKAWIAAREARNEPITEVKAEVGIDRITGTANRNGPRFFERVPSGAEFDFELRWKVMDGDDQSALRSSILAGIKLLELDGLGGQVSRGYGRVAFDDLRLDGEPVQLPADPFGEA
ncbi:MAG: type III-A CRISPR-associated RAMP protein Csm3 [Deltaproteobacteria bacterium]|nr:type III-A CRISPR-associated RAMP protein Csm3 [Deltaproteobacteria bacterium]